MINRVFSLLVCALVVTGVGYVSARQSLVAQDSTKAVKAEKGE